MSPMDDSKTHPGAFVAFSPSSGDFKGGWNATDSHPAG